MRPAPIILAAATALLVSACSLAGDVTPPPGPRTTASPPATDPAAAATAPPSALAGALLYAEHCAACHGETGRGDGPLVPQLASQGGGPLPDFSSPDRARSTAPASWFQVITQGRLERLMPPWGDRLSEAERWNLIAYLYALSMPQDHVEAGRTLYQAECARCHGEAGQGDGVEAQALAQPLPSFADRAYVSARSLDEFFDAVTHGVGEAMPAYGDALTADERWAVLDYVRTLSFDYISPELMRAEGTGAVTGVVSNGTSGAPLPPDLPIVLHGFDGLEEAVTLTTTTVEGAFHFDAVPYRAGRRFIATTTYAEVLYGSEVLAFDPRRPALDLPLTIYETTADPEAVRVERAHLFLEFAQGQMTVGELFIFSNHGDRTFLNPERGLEIALPPGAKRLNVQGAEPGVDFVLTPQGFALLQPLRPGRGSAQVLFAFTLPYDRRLDFTQALLYPVDMVNVLVPEGGVRVQGDGLQDLGAQNVQGSLFYGYSAANLTAGETLAFRLSGDPAGAASGLLAVSNPVGVFFGVLVLGLVLAGGGYWWYHQRGRGGGRAADDLAARREALLAQIARLDDDFDAGDVDEREYARERARLKEDLLRVWDGWHD
jgi:mono/diheme cytochrome c family protein